MRKTKETKRFMKKSTLLAVSLALLTICMPHQANAKKKKAKAALALLKDSAKDGYANITKDGKVVHGMFTIIYKAKEGKLYFEIPDSAFSKLYMLSNRIASTSDTKDFVAGQMINTPKMISLSKDERNVYFNLVQSGSYISPDDPIAASFHKNFVSPRLKGFKITARNGKNVVIDVTSFFGTNESSISPLKEDSPISKLLGGGGGIKGVFAPDASGIDFAKAFPRNIEIESTLSFNTTGAIRKPYSVTVHRSLFELPDTLMPMRYQDNRVGYFYSDKNIYSSNADKVENKTYINRWRIEPKPEDRAKYFSGEKVEPLKPIVFYVDSAFPPKWKSTIKAGIEDWNKAFEAAGFKHAVIARDYPKDDPDFDPDDMRYNCFKYAATATANAMGPSYTDPRTGEILAADVIWYHNIISLLHNWRLVQTAAVDKRVRKAVFDDDVMCESMRYAASHEVGHTLGLMHNMGASYSFPVDSLRSPSFTQKYGTTPSIMDYARNNYIAQPGDMERGVKLTPPQLGVYDIYAINWGYRLIKDANTPDAEKPILDRWIADKSDDPMFQFGAQQVFGTVDPTDLTEDLGNDHIKASDYGISNMKILMKNLLDWTMEKGERYDDTETIYREIVKQYSRYINHVVPYIGGIVYDEIRQGDGKAAARKYVSRVQQKKALAWLLNQIRTYDTWLTPQSIITKLELNMDVNDKLRKQVIGSLLNGATLYRIKEGGIINPTANYTVDAYLDDFVNMVFKTPVGGKLTDSEQSLQAEAIATMIQRSGLMKQASGAKSATTLLDRATSDIDEPSLPCSLIDEGQHSFVRINFGGSTLAQSELGALMTGRLKRIMQKFNAYRTSSTGSTRDFYNYQIMQIERIFSNK